MHHLRPPRLGAIGRQAADVDGRARRRRGAAADRAADPARARLRRLDGRDGGAGARAAAPGAGARPGARRDDAGRPVRAAAGAGSTCWRSRAAGWRSAACAGRCCSRRSSAASSPSACASCVRHFTAHRSSAAAIGAQTAGQRALQRPCRVCRGCARRRSSCTASATASSRSPPRSCWPPRIPDAELAVVPGAGHAYALEAPRRVARAAARVARAPAAPIPSERGSTCGV